MRVARTSRPLARKAYRRAVAPLGLRRLRKMLAGGLPTPFGRPLEFLFDGRLDPAERRLAHGVEEVREAVARDPRVFRVLNRDGVVRPVTGAQVARSASIGQEWGTFLHLCARSFGARGTEPQDTPYGQREYEAIDIEGHRWWFSMPTPAP